MRSNVMGELSFGRGTTAASTRAGDWAGLAAAGAPGRQPATLPERSVTVTTNASRRRIGGLAN
jgi:hypothetical protein